MRTIIRILAVAAIGPAFAADIVLTPPPAGGVSVTNAAGSVVRFRVGEDGLVTLPGLGAAPGPLSGLCVEIASGRVGTCSIGTLTSIAAGTGLTGGTITTTGTIGIALGYQLPQSCGNGQVPASNGFGGWGCSTVTSGTVTAVTASAPLASSGGTAPNITISGAIPVASGGTGQSTLTANGILFGQGAAAVGVTVGSAGQVLAGTAGAPSWTNSPSLSGNLTLVASTASAGNILKAGMPFIHNAGTRNTFVGIQAGNLTMFGHNNVGIGYGALLVNSDGYDNTATGHKALESNTTGINNTAVGVGALRNNTSGHFNTAVGAHANGSGTLNIAVGYNASSNVTSGVKNIMVGSEGVAGDALTIRIGADQVRAFVAGVRGVTTGSANAVAVLIDSAGQLGTVNSSRRVKDGIADMASASDGLMQLRPVTFLYKSVGDPQERMLHYGLVAEEVADVYPGLVAHSPGGEVETVMYQFLTPMLLNEYQKQRRLIDAARTEVESLRREVVHLTRALERLERNSQVNTATR